MKPKAIYTPILVTLLLCSVCSAQCPTPLVTYLDDTQITFDGTTAHCRVKIDAGAGQTLAIMATTSGTTVEAYDGIDWVDGGLGKQLDYNVQVQTVDLTWEMVKETNACICNIWATNDCDVSTGWVETAYYTYPPQDHTIFLYIGAALIAIFAWLAIRKRPQPPRR